MNTGFEPIEHIATARRTRAAGWFIIVLGAAAAMLPLIAPAHGAAIIGTLLILAGLAEILVATMRHETRKLAIAAGAVTVVAGLLFSTDPATRFLPSVTIVMGWLFLRSLILAAACLLERGSVRLWTGLSAATDLILALILAVGISIAAFVVSLFGATPELIASFAWLLAISFAVTGLLLLEVADCAGREDV